MKFKLSKLKKILFLSFAFVLLLTPFFISRSVAINEGDTVTYTSNIDGSFAPQSSSEGFISGKMKKNIKKFVPDENGRLQEINTVEEVPSGMGPNIIGFLFELVAGSEQIEYDPNTKEVVSYRYDPGLTESVMATTGQLYVNKPIEPASYQVMAAIDKAKEKLNMVDSVYAAPEDDSSVYFPGLGNDILQPIRGFWNMNLNIAYGFMIIIIFVIAILMLFRQKLNGQDVISLTNALPSLILSIVLMSFSFPISGLFIDIITIGSNLAQSVLLSSNNAPGSNIWKGTILWTELGCGDTNAKEGICNFATFLKTTAQTDTDFHEQNPNVGAILERQPAKTGLQIDDPLISVWLIFGTANLDISREALQETKFLPSADMLQARTPIGPLVNSLVGMMDNFQGSLGGLASMLLSVVFAFAAFMSAVKTFFNLIKAWLTLVLYPIVSPFIFLISAIPSMQGKIISGYLKTMLGASLSFVGVYVVFLVILIITNEPLIQGFSFAPPLLGYLSGNAGVGTGGEVIRVLFGYTLFLTAPMVPQAVNDFIAQGSAAVFKEGGANALKETKAAAQQLFGMGSSLIQGQVGAGSSRFPA